MDFHVKNVKSITCYFILTIHGIHRNYSGQNLYLKKKGGTASSFRGPASDVSYGGGGGYYCAAQKRIQWRFFVCFCFYLAFCKAYIDIDRLSVVTF